VFTREELIAALPGLASSPMPLLEVVEFGNLDFTIPGSEQTIWAFRGSKRDFASGLLFWVKTLQAQDIREGYFISYATAGLCQPISKAEFARLVEEYSGSLRSPLPPFLCYLDGFRSGLRMYAEWNDIGAVAELTEDFVAFYWSTTA